MANVSPEVFFRMLFLTLSSADVNFLSRKLWWRTNTTKKALLTTRYVELVGKKEFAAAGFDSKSETFIIHIASLSSVALLSSSLLKLNIYPFCKPQVSNLINKEAPTKVPAKYLNFTDLFFSDLAFKLPKYIRINNHAIKLVNGQKLLYKPIYSQEPVELETLKAYIKTNLVNRFIRPSKSPAGALILFEWKLDSFFRLCVNYQGLNNLTIKNRNPLPLIRESLNKLERAKQFTQLDLTSAYY